MSNLQGLFTIAEVSSNVDETSIRNMEDGTIQSSLHTIDNTNDNTRSKKKKTKNSKKKSSKSKNKTKSSKKSSDKNRATTGGNDGDGSSAMHTTIIQNFDEVNNRDENSKQLTQQDQQLQQEQRPLQWLLDRIQGTSQYHSRIGKPPTYFCYVPFIVGQFPRALETNKVLRTVGKLGCVDPDSVGIRHFVFGNALVANLIGCLLTLFAALAISDNPYVLRKTSFSTGRITINNNAAIPPIYVDVGLRAMSFRQNAFFNTTTVWHFDEFCAQQQLSDNNSIYDNIGFIINPNQCHGCADASNGLVSVCILSLLTYIPTISTNVLRMWPNYDVNCQKFCGIVVGTLSLLLSMYTWRGYRQSCFSTISRGQVPVTSSLDRFTISLSSPSPLVDYNTNTAAYEFDFDWKAGNGMLCIVTATILKMIDVICHLIVPTPSITRDRREQLAYEELRLNMSNSSSNVYQHQQQFDALQARYRLKNAKMSAVRSTTDPHFAASASTDIA